MMPLRVVHVISGIDRADGGPTTALLGLTSALSRLSADVTVVATPVFSECQSVVQELAEKGVAVRLADRGRSPFNRDSKLRKILLEEIGRADVVHIHALWEEAQYQAARISRLHQKPFVVRPCGLLDPWSLAQHRLKKRLYLELRLRRLLDSAAGIHFTTPLEEEGTRSLGIMAPSIVEPNGLDLAEFERFRLRGWFRKRLEIPGEVPLVLFLGRIHPKKGLDILIQAFADAAPRDAVLAIAGTGEVHYEKQLRSKAASCGVADRTRFVGFLEGRERIAAYADASVFVLPSHSENFGNAVIESLAAGTPVIVSDQVSLHGRISAASVGGVVPTDWRALSGEIHSWLSDSSRREVAIANAKAFLAPYDLKEVATRWLRRYRDLRRVSHGGVAA